MNWGTRKNQGLERVAPMAELIEIKPFRVRVYKIEADNYGFSFSGRHPRVSMSGGDGVYVAFPSNLPWRIGQEVEVTVRPL